MKLTGYIYCCVGRLARGLNEAYGTRHPYTKNKDQVLDLTCWASYMVGHSWQHNFETTHNLDWL